MEVLNQEQQSSMAEKQSFDDYAITPRSDLEQGNKEPRGRNYFRAETLPRFKNRNSIVIISDILEAASCPALKTSLMHQTQSSYAMIMAYLKFGLERGLLKKICGPEGTQYYKTTDLGFEYLAKFHSLIELFTSNKVAYKRPFSGPYEFLTLR